MIYNELFAIIRVIASTIVVILYIMIYIHYYNNVYCIKK